MPNDLWNKALARRPPLNEEIAIPVADVEHSWTAPDRGVRGLQLTLDDDVATWRWDVVTGNVAGGAGTPVWEKGTLNWGEGLFIGTIFFAADTGSINMRVDYQSA